MIASLFRFQVRFSIQILPVMVAALIISACADMTGESSLSRFGRPVIVDGLDVSFMGAVIERGFEEVRDRALYKPDVDDLFTAALGELRSIDRNLSIEVTDGRILLTVGEKVASDIGEAPRGDVTQWSRATIEAILLARRESELFHQADGEAFYVALFDGALSRLDRFSRYADRRDAARNRFVREGVIGLGIRVAPALDGALVQAIVRDGPAAAAGVMNGDLIVAVDDVSLSHKTLSEIRRHLEGQAKGSVELTIRRPNTTKAIVIEAQRELIVPDTVTSRVVDGVAELKISGFNQRTAHAVEKAVSEAIASTDNDLKGLILDLRGDPGGLLDQAIAMADLFLDHGSIAELRGRHPGSNQSYSAGRGDITAGLPIAIIVDGRAASAAEIVVAALQDNHRAVVVGTVTLGKGSVQTIIRLPNNGELALTWSRATTPGGVGLEGLGILPDICLSGEVATAGAIISRLFVAPNPMAGVRSLWLNPAHGSDHEITSLRGKCPAETRTDRALDLQVARRIVSDPTLLSIAVPYSNSQLAVTP